MNPKLLLFLIVDTLLVAGVLLFVFTRESEDSSNPGPTASSAPADPAHPDSPDAQAQFVAALHAAHDSKDNGAMMELVWTKDADPNALANLKSSLANDFQAELLDAKVVPLDADTALEYTLRGVRYVPNLPPTGQLVLTWKQEDGQSTTTLLIGFHNQRYWIISAKPVRE